MSRHLISTVIKTEKWTVERIETIENEQLRTLLLVKKEKIEERIKM